MKLTEIELERALHLQTRSQLVAAKEALVAQERAKVAADTAAFEQGVCARLGIVPPLRVKHDGTVECHPMPEPLTEGTPP